MDDGTRLMLSRMTSFFIRQDNIAVFSHKFYNQLLFAQVAELVMMLDTENNDTFQRRLVTEKESDLPEDVSLKEHAEIRCGKGEPVYSQTKR